MRLGFFIIGPALILALGLISCSKKPPVRTPQGSSAPIPVLVAKAQTRDIPVVVSAVGNVRAYSTVSVRAQVTGPIVKVHFEEGQEVKEGDLLFSIDPRPFEATLAQVQANLKRDEAQLANMQLAFLRASNLFESKIMSQSDYDTAATAFRGGQATIMADRAAITNAQINLGYTTIRSPIDGRTGSLAVKAGNIVKVTDDVLVTITRIRPIYVSFSVPESYLPEIRRRVNETKLPVEAFSTSATNDVASGELTFIDNTVDPNTGTIALKGTFPNTNSILWPGQFVQTTLKLNMLTGATVVPSQAVQMGQAGAYLFVVNPDSTVEVRTNLLTGVNYEGQTVVSRGVAPGESVVIDGQLKLKPGSKVSIKTGQGTHQSTNTTGAVP